MANVKICFALANEMLLPLFYTVLFQQLCTGSAQEYMCFTPIYNKNKCFLWNVQNCFKRSKTLCGLLLN